MNFSRLRPESPQVVPWILQLFLLLSLASAWGCGVHSAPAQQVGQPAAQGVLRGPQRRPSVITHVVVVIQENRSFDDLFQGYPGANTSSTGQASTGQTVALQPVSFTADYDIIHQSQDFLNAYDNGKMDGFNLERLLGHPKLTYPQYGYVPASQTKLYFEMANQYVLADNMFQSNIDASFAAHQYLIAAQAGGNGTSGAAANIPSGRWGCDYGQGDKVDTLNADRSVGPREGPCFDYTTLADELDGAGLSWRYYAAPSDNAGGNWSAYMAVNHIRNGPDWANVITPPGQFLTDVAAGKLANVTWVTPTYKDSDHAANHSKQGPAWVASVVNAVGESSFWDSTVVFVVWDDWGGWYDHVPPIYLDYDGLGFRVPMLVISAYAKQNYVSHVQYEFGSVLRFIEDDFGLGQLSASDARATDPAADSLNVSGGPRSFVPFKTGVSPRTFVDERQDGKAPDDE
jgi:phospholipase C